MIKLEKVSKKFATGVFGLSEIDLLIERGEFVFVTGPTGAGKSTLFRLLIRDTLPTEGSIVINNWDIVKLPGNLVPELRKKVGVIFQDLKLLTDRTIFENIALPLEVVGVSEKEILEKVEKAMTDVGIIEHKEKFPIQLSGGELQRAAIARALVLSPEILLADEPTGNLDVGTSWEIVKILSEINEKGTTVVMATHNTDIVRSMGKRTVELEKGKIVKDSKKKPHKTEEDKKEAEKKEDK